MGLTDQDSSSLSKSNGSPEKVGIRLRYQGRVQGVGFRPTVWRLAKELKLTGSVFNDRSGAVVEIWGIPSQLQEFQSLLPSALPTIAQIISLNSEALTSSPPAEFQIVESSLHGSAFQVLPDLANCTACLEEVTQPTFDRYRYPLTNCTHCGPRYSIIEALPYDRANTSMRSFPLCEVCLAEFTNPNDRRFHAQPIACHRCGPQTHLERLDDQHFDREELSKLDEIDAAARLLQQGEIIAIQGIGGFHLACDATNTDVVQRLRQRKIREAKPFALMGKNRKMLEQWCSVNELEWRELSSPIAPIVLLKKNQQSTMSLSEAVAPNQRRLGWMLPYTPLHHLLFELLGVPLVFTSGNLSDEPQCKTPEEARNRLKGFADWLLWNERPIINRVDDSILRIEGKTVRVLRRARGLAPDPIPLPAGFERAPSVWTFGASLKNTFCRVIDDHAVLSPHIGDLHEARAITDFEASLQLFEHLYPQPTSHVAVDLHIDYPCTRIGEEYARQHQLPVMRLQHHHAHLAACLAEHLVPLETTPVLGIILDGLGMGPHDELWGGEILLGDYRSAKRLGMLKPVALLGGEKAMREPWRNTLAHLLSSLGWDHFLGNYGQLELAGFLKKQPVSTYQSMLQLKRNAPLASSGGRLFDAVAAAIGLCQESVSFEGQAAMQLQSLAEEAYSVEDIDSFSYPFAILEWKSNRLPYLEPQPMWQALLNDLVGGTPNAVIALRFHRGLAQGLWQIVQHLQTTRIDCRSVKQVVLSGGVFQNELLAQLLERKLQAQGLSVLRPEAIPCNDGGISLGQAMIAIARILDPQFP